MKIRGVELNPGDRVIIGGRRGRILGFPFQREISVQFDDGKVNMFCSIEDAHPEKSGDGQ